MTRTLTALLAASLVLSGVPAAAQSPQDEQRFQQAQQRFQNELSIFQQEFDRYQRARASRPSYDPRYDDRGGPDDGYDAAQYYRPGQSERVLGSDDRVYRGSDGRYYCRRNDGTTGLIVGGAAGGILGNAIAPRGSRTLGSILGIVGGAALGGSIDRNRVSCR